jgi:hypothetical protein
MEKEMVLQEAVNYEYYKDRISKRVFDHLVTLDPTPDKKYGRWIVECYIRAPLGTIDKAFEIYRNEVNQNTKNDPNINGQATQKLTMALKNMDPAVANRLLTRFWNEDAQKITQDLIAYTKLKNKKLLTPEQMNILNIKSFSALVEIIIDHEEELANLEEIDSSEYEKWYEDDKWLVVVPKTHAAACKYGANTRWCTASRDYDTYFKQYSEDGPLIDIIAKNPKVPGSFKWQLHFDSDQWMDAQDREIKNRMEFIEGLPKPLQQAIYDHTGRFVFNPKKYEMIMGFLNNPTDFKAIQYWLNSQSFFSKLYGLKNENYRDQYLITDYIDGKLYYYAYSQWKDESDYYDDDGYQYGYNHPWDYLKDQKPENLPENPDDYHSEEDPDFWSEEQRSEAGNEAESQARDEAVQQGAKEFNFRWFSEYSERTRGKDSPEKFYDILVADVLSMQYYPQETTKTVMNLIELFSDDTEELMNQIEKERKLSTTAVP